MFAEARGSLQWTYAGFSADWLRPSYAAVSWPRKLLRYRTNDGPRYQLYYLDVDPGERIDLFPGIGGGTDPLIAEIESYAKDCSSQQISLRAMGAGAGGRSDAVRDEKLRALGYIE